MTQLLIVAQILVYISTIIYNLIIGIYPSKKYKLIIASSGPFMNQQDQGEQLSPQRQVLRDYENMLLESPQYYQNQNPMTSDGASPTSPKKNNRSFRKASQKPTVARHMEILNSGSHDSEILSLVHSKNSHNRTTLLPSRSSFRHRKRSNFQNYYGHNYKDNNLTQNSQEKSNMNSDIQDLIPKTRRAKKKSLVGKQQGALPYSRQKSKADKDQLNQTKDMWDGSPDKLMTLELLESDTRQQDGDQLDDEKARPVSVETERAHDEQLTRNVMIFDNHHQLTTLMNMSPSPHLTQDADHEQLRQQVNLITSPKPDQPPPLTSEDHQPQLNNTNNNSKDDNLLKLSLQQEDTPQNISPTWKFRALDPNQTNSTLGLSNRKLEKTASNHHVQSDPNLPPLDVQESQVRDVTTEKTKEKEPSLSRNNQGDRTFDGRQEGSIEMSVVQDEEIAGWQRQSTQAQAIERNIESILNTRFDPETHEPLQPSANEQQQQQPEKEHAMKQIEERKKHRRSTENSVSSDKADVYLIGKDQYWIKQVQYRLQQSQSPNPANHSQTAQTLNKHGANDDKMGDSTLDGGKQDKSRGKQQSRQQHVHDGSKRQQQNLQAKTTTPHRGQPATKQQAVSLVNIGVDDDVRKKLKFKTGAEEAVAVPASFAAGGRNDTNSSQNNLFPNFSNENQPVQTGRKFQRQLRLESYQNLSNETPRVAMLNQSAFVTTAVSKASTTQKRYQKMDNNRTQSVEKSHSPERMDDQTISAGLQKPLSYWQTSQNQFANLADKRPTKKKGEGSASPTRFRKLQGSQAETLEEATRTVSFNEFKKMLKSQRLSMSPVEKGQQGSMSNKYNPILQKYNIVHQILGGSSREAQQIKQQYLKMLLSKSIETDKLMPVIEPHGVHSNIQNKAHMHHKQVGKRQPDQQVLIEAQLNPVHSRNRIGATSVESIKSKDKLLNKNPRATVRHDGSRQFIHMNSSQNFLSQKSADEQQKIINLQRVPSTSINIDGTITDYNQQKRLENRSRAFTNENKGKTQYKLNWSSQVGGDLTFNMSQNSIQKIPTNNDQVRDFDYTNSTQQIHILESQRTSVQSILSQNQQQVVSTQQKEQIGDVLSPIMSQMNNEYSESPKMTTERQSQVIGSPGRINLSQVEVENDTKAGAALENTKSSVEYLQNASSQSEAQTPNQKQNLDFEDIVKNDQKLIAKERNLNVTGEITEVQQESSQGNTAENVKEISINEATKSFIKNDAEKLKIKENPKTVQDNPKDDYEQNELHQTSSPEVQSTELRLREGSHESRIHLAVKQMNFDDNKNNTYLHSPPPNDTLSPNDLSQSPVKQSQKKTNERKDEQQSSARGKVNSHNISVNTGNLETKRNENASPTNNIGTLDQQILNKDLIRIHQPEVSMKVTMGNNGTGIQPGASKLSKLSKRDNTTFNINQLRSQANRTQDPKITFVLDKEMQMTNVLKEARGGNEKEKRGVKLPQIGNRAMAVRQSKATFKEASLKNMNFQYPDLHRQFQQIPAIEGATNQEEQKRQNIQKYLQSQNKASAEQSIQENLHISQNNSNLPRLRMVNSSKLRERQQKQEKNETNGNLKEQSPQTTQHQNNLMMRGTNLRQVNNDEVLITSIEEGSLDSLQTFNTKYSGQIENGFAQNHRHASIEVERDNFQQLLPKKKLEQGKNNMASLGNSNRKQGAVQDFYKQFGRSQIVTYHKMKNQNTDHTQQYEAHASQLQTPNPQNNASSLRDDSQLSMTQPLILSDGLQKELQSSNILRSIERDKYAERNMNKQSLAMLGPQGQLGKPQTYRMKAKKYDSLNSKNDLQKFLSQNRRIRMKQQPSNIQIPNPSSMKDLVADGQFFGKLQQRMHDEAEDMHTCVRSKAMAMSCRHVASGRYGLGRNAYNTIRLDSAQKRREIKRMNQTIRQNNLQKVQVKRDKYRLHEARLNDSLYAQEFQIQDNRNLYNSQEQPTTIVMKLKIIDNGPSKEQNTGDNNKSIEGNDTDENLRVYLMEHNINGNGGQDHIQIQGQNTTSQEEESMGEFKPTQFSHRILDQIVTKESQEKNETQSQGGGATRSRIDKSRSPRRGKQSQRNSQNDIPITKSLPTSRPNEQVLTRVVTHGDLKDVTGSADTSNEDLTEQAYLQPGPIMTSSPARNPQRKLIDRGPSGMNALHVLKQSSDSPQLHNLRQVYQNSDLMQNSLGPKTTNQSKLDQSNMINFKTMTSGQEPSMQSTFMNDQDFQKHFQQSSPLTYNSIDYSPASHLPQLVIPMQQKAGDFKINPQKVEMRHQGILTQHPSVRTRPKLRMKDTLTQMRISNQKLFQDSSSRFHNPFFKPQNVMPSDQDQHRPFEQGHISSQLYLNETSGDLTLAKGASHTQIMMDMSTLHLHNNQQQFAALARISKMPLSHQSVKKTANQIVTNALKSAERKIGHGRGDRDRIARRRQRARS